LLATPSQTVGPFFSFGLCECVGDDQVVGPEAAGALELGGAVLDGAGVGVPDAMVELWQADAEGAYRDDFGWARSGTTEAGEYSFVTVKPGAVPAEDDRLQAPHLTLLVFARGLLKPVHTRMYFPDEEAANKRDPLLSALVESDRAALVAELAGGALRFDIRLQGERQTPFFVVP
jgi:protocatechuate 3,4-dioxygenase, alpha subunit